MAIGEVRVHLQRFFQLLHSGVTLPRIVQYLAEVALILEIQGIEFDGAVQVADSFRMTRLPGEKKSIPVVGTGRFGLSSSARLNSVSAAEKSNRLQNAPARAA